MLSKYKLFWFQVLVAGIALHLCFMSVDAQEEVQCLGQDLNMTQAQKDFLTDCLREVKVSNVWNLPMEKVSCFGVCVLEKKSLVNKNGGLDHDKIYSYIMDTMKPDSVKKPIVDGVEKCIKDHGTTIRVPNDPNCLAFIEVGQCVHDVFLGQCVEG